VYTLTVLGKKEGEYPNSSIPVSYVLTKLIKPSAIYNVVKKVTFTSDSKGKITGRYLYG
jgi:hypothetical protein